MSEKGKGMSLTNPGCDIAGRFREACRDLGAAEGRGAEASGAVLGSKWLVVEAAVRCLFIFLGGELGWTGVSISSLCLPRRAVTLRFLEAVLPVEVNPDESAAFRTFSAVAACRAAERVCLEDIEIMLMIWLGWKSNHRHEEK